MSYRKQDIRNSIQYLRNMIHKIRYKYVKYKICVDKTILNILNITL